MADGDCRKSIFLVSNKTPRARLLATVKFRMVKNGVSATQTQSFRLTFTELVNVIFREFVELNINEAIVPFP